MAQRLRPISRVNEPTEDERAQTAAVIDEAVADLTEAANSVIVRLSRITNPIERARAAATIRAHTTSELASATDGIFRDAVIEAYTRGRADYGWHGYGALALELGMSRAKVQQIVNGSWGGKAKRPEESRAAREKADHLRQVRRLADKGKSVPEIVADTGLDENEVRFALDLGAPEPT